jgi:3-hydroxyisobutyrate dehydrogenase
MEQDTVVTVVGAGALGAAMAARLGETGYRVRLWNRTPERARVAADGADGVAAVGSLTEALSGASFVLTLLRDGPAVAEVMGPALAGLDSGAVWVQASTVGPEHAAELAATAAAQGVSFLDAPVSGSTAPARQGKLVWLVAGEPAVVERARPVLDALGSSVLEVGSGVEGSALKLAVNAWMASATVAMSDVLGLCDALGIAHDTLARALEAGALTMPYALQKMRLMDSGEFDPGFAVQLALKDVDLARESAPLGPLLAVVRQRLEQAVEAGHGDQDLAAVDTVRVRP